MTAGKWARAVRDRRVDLERYGADLLDNRDELSDTDRLELLDVLEFRVDELVKVVTAAVKAEMRELAEEPELDVRAGTTWMCSGSHDEETRATTFIRVPTGRESSIGVWVCEPCAVKLRGGATA